MILERAVLQQVSRRDGVDVAEPYFRPSEIRAVAARMMGWRHGAPEKCHNCSENATHIRQRVPVCAACREQVVARLDSVVSGRGMPAMREAPASQTQNAITGHFIVFDQWSVNLGDFVERIRPSAVDRAVRAGADVGAFWSHDPSEPIGRTPDTLQVRKTPIGLWGEIHMSPMSANRIETVQRGIVRGASFGFSTIDDEWAFGDGIAERTIHDMHVHEISPVFSPAYPQTSIGVTSLAERQQRDHEMRLRMAR